MNDPRTSALNLWSRLISGETLDQVDRQKLIDFVQRDSELRDEIEADASLNALLRSATDVLQTEDQFVQGVLDRCPALDDGPQSKGESNRIGHGVAADFYTASPVDEVPKTTPANGTATPIATNRRRRGPTAYRKSRQPSMWAATALTAAVFACLGLIVWSQLGPPLSQTGGTSPKEVVQGPKGAKTDNAASSKNQDPSPSRPIGSHPAQPNRAPREFQEPAIAETPQKRPDQQNEEIANRPDSESQSQFVTLTKIQDPVWERKNRVGDRIGSEIVRLFAGSVELTFDKGAVVTVNGPVEFRPLSTGKLEVKRGRIFASVPRKAVGFTVSTPTSNVVDLGTEFEVTVNDTGESDVQVHKGEVEVASINPNGDEFQKWRLVPNKFDHASFYARPRIQGATPISTSLRGPRGQFQGFVSINGQTAEFTSPETFQSVRRRAETELMRSQKDALKQWKAFVASMQNDIQGTMNVNGQKMQFGSLHDVMRMQHQMLENVQKAGSNSTESSFKGSINVNGKIMNFNTREEYDAARRAAFGPAATFGIGDVLGNE